MSLLNRYDAEKCSVLSLTLSLPFPLSIHTVRTSFVVRIRSQNAYVFILFLCKKYDNPIRKSAPRQSVFAEMKVFCIRVSQHNNRR